MEWFLIALITKAESHSSQRLFQWYCLASSMALIAPSNSAWKALHSPVFSAKHKSKSASWFQKMPLQAEEWLVEEPSVLHFNQWGIRDLQITSMILGALGGWIVSLNFTRQGSVWYNCGQRTLPVNFLVGEPQLISSKPNWINDVNHGSSNH